MLKAGLLTMLVVLAAPQVPAQSFNLTTPVTQPSEEKYRVKQYHLDDTGTVAAPNPLAVIGISVRDSGNTKEIRTFNVVIPSTACGSATVNGLATAEDTERSGEPAGALGKKNFRILGYLSDNGCGFPAGTLSSS